MTTHLVRGEAKRDFATARRRWLAKAGKNETTHRPFYGGPVDERTAANSWVPGTGLNLIPRNATPVGTRFAASMVIAVQMDVR
jgi:hypothetical protein